MRSRYGEPMPIISLHVPKQMLKEIDELVRSGVYRNRSEVIRAAIRELLQRVHRPQNEGGQEEEIPLLKGR